MTAEEKATVLKRYADGLISAEHAADLLGPRASVAEVVLATRDLLGRLPDRDDAFTRNEFRRALELLGLPADAAPQSSSSSRATTDCGSPKNRL